MTERELHTPCYVIDHNRLEDNLRVLRGVIEHTGCRILLAQKAFSCYSLYPLIAEYLNGATASGLFEARLCHEEMPNAENHIFSPAFRNEDMNEILSICDHIIFNSIRQLKLYGRRAKAAGLQVGLRINPQISTQPTEHAIYDPCIKGSRLGVTLQEFKNALYGSEYGAQEWLYLLDGLHFHTLCEQNSHDLEITLNSFKDQFREWLPIMKWVNFGGGHHITREDYDIPRLERCITSTMDEFGVDIYLEPGEAVALNAGYLYTTVLEVQSHENTIDVAILDTSAACHMPDVIEMPYRPPLRNSGAVSCGADGVVVAHDKPYSYRLAGPTCLSGDIIGDYSFNSPLQENDLLIFEDMAIYSMVKNNTFNGMPLPAIYIKNGTEYTLLKSFGYHDFKSRL